MLTNSLQAPPIITSGTKLACPSCTLHRPTSWAHVATLNSQQNKEWNSLQFTLYWHRGVFGLACLQTQSQSSPDEHIMARVATRSWTLLFSIQMQKLILLPHSNRSLLVWTKTPKLTADGRCCSRLLRTKPERGKDRKRTPDPITWPGSDGRDKDKKT
jgi:hypothetical protein